MAHLHSPSVQHPCVHQKGEMNTTTTTTITTTTTRQQCNNNATTMQQQRQCDNNNSDNNDSDDTTTMTVTSPSCPCSLRYFPCPDMSICLCSPHVPFTRSAFCC